MNLSGVIAIAYGILVLAGGTLGYVQAKSTASLLSGCISGLLLLIAGVVQLQGYDWGLLLALVITVMLAIVFVVRLLKTRKIMPAGIMTAASVAVLVILLSSL